ncbi:DHA2 family efflux MFS transporter permease subunit [Sphaerisporangium sp. TRM90804]|uniref:DHA2 family efflux MFS transporter permease subunit n=1 Tax=Sphaerisporangium sp. TRM90804 TaxID=3031113 RepID=UPI00244B3116|nr:DHA2 family efflux MFS transporter permease subunit [Sphaerisporangium sp. TRM90804]MDH2428409.1 DHA2 family efflux MFS transporter permease subunit [Sphaerisporangium sp. TRM90804]
MSPRAGRERRVNPWLALLVLCVANFLILLDSTIVNIAAPDMMTTLDAGIDEVLWVLNGYLLAFASLLILFGRLGDVFGPRAVFVAGLGVFTVASALCGLSQTPELLIAARVLQGVGAAALLPQAITLISAIFPAERRGAAFGIFAAVAGVASVSGPTLGGLLVTHLGWQSIFWLNVPVALAGAALAFRFVPALRPRAPHRFDVPGVLLATGALSALVYALVEGQRHGWGTVAGPVTIPGIFVTAVVLGVLFVLWERRHPEPLLPLALFRNRNYTIATLITLIVSFALYGLMLVLVIETQTVLGMSPLMSGVAGLPLTVALSALAPVAGRLADRIGGRIPLVAGLTLYGAGLLAVAFVPTTSSTALTYVAPLLVVGVGLGLAFAPATTEAMRDIVPAQVGAASGVLNTARQVGAALGAAVIGAVLQNRLVEALFHEARERAPSLPPEAREPYVTGFADAAARGLGMGGGQSGGVAPPAGLAPDVAERFARLAHDAFAEAFMLAARPALTGAAAVVLAGAVLAVFITRRARPAPAEAVPATPRTAPARYPAHSAAFTGGGTESTRGEDMGTGREDA